MFHTNKLNLGRQCKIEMFLIVIAWNVESEKTYNCPGKCFFVFKKRGYHFNISLNFTKNNNHDRMLFSPTNRDAKWKKINK
jgi:hypothetical protein